MPISELLLPEFDSEIATTRRVLERVPTDKGSWKPHEKSFPMGHLAQLVARLPGWVNMIMDRDELDIAPVDGPKFPGYSLETTETLLAEFDKNAAAGRASIEKATDAALGETWTLKAAGHAMQGGTRYFMLRTTVLNHLVHHRAQLGLYLRMVDEKVPSMYGPTADDKQK
ncbi:MAG: DinB family protein [Gemmatimonadetes bacterium]|nr:DinB family protein [Gemmatimonadota bacterium]